MLLDAYIHWQYCSCKIKTTVGGEESEGGEYSQFPICGVVTGLFLSKENTIGPAIDLLALVVREASRDRR